MSDRDLAEDLKRLPTQYLGRVRAAPIVDEASRQVVEEVAMVESLMQRREAVSLEAEKAAEKVFRVRRSREEGVSACIDACIVS